MSEPVPQRPTNDGRAGWKAYWAALGMQWRTEPEIDEERQRFLAERRTIEPNVEHGIYPFKNIKLARADVEWLLATHESRGKVGPVVWEEERDTPDELRREGLDLRGADLRGAGTWQGENLSGLPLALTRAGASSPRPGDQLRKRIRLAVVELQVAREAAVRLEGANLSHADLRGATLYHARLEYATLQGAHLEGATLSLAYLNHALFHDVHLEGTEMGFANLAGADLIGVHVASEPTLGRTQISRPFDLRGAAFDNHSAFDETTLGAGKNSGFTRLAYVDWGDANLAIVDWGTLQLVGDERVARLKRSNSRRKSRQARRVEFEEATQANQRLAVVLRNQGLSEHADRFAYHAHLCQRKVYRYDRKLIKQFGSFLLDLISGYGYKPVRSFITYVVVVVAFAATYFGLGGANGQPLSWNEAIVVSMTAFHGRGFFAAVFQPGDVQAAVAAVEAFIGLLIEITFIATFTQRFFAR